VRLLTRRGHDWSDRYPLITQAALRLRKSSFVIDGEAVVLGPDGISDFDGLHSGRCNEDVRLYAPSIFSRMLGLICATRPCELANYGWRSC
jgi:bifunctional non-homologous end joining protein LigD